MDQRVNRILYSAAPEQGTDEWLAWRRFKLTASDCSKIIGNAVKSRQRRYTRHVNECLHQLSKSDSGAASCTERRNSCNYTVFS
eukprot:2923-Heterococcus_DN1.PRE.1